MLDDVRCFNDSVNCSLLYLHDPKFRFLTYIVFQKSCLLFGAAEYEFDVVTYTGKVMFSTSALHFQ